MKNMNGYDLGDILDLFGLTRKRTTLEVLLPALGLLVAGAALGAGAGLAFAPASGRRFRHDLREEVGGRIGQIRERIQSERKPPTNNAIPHQNA
jgi:hypothetical protein